MRTATTPHAMTPHAEKESCKGVLGTSSCQLPAIGGHNIKFFWKNDLPTDMAVPGARKWQAGDICSRYLGTNVGRDIKIELIR